MTSIARNLNPLNLFRKLQARRAQNRGLYYERISKPNKPTLRRVQPQDQRARTNNKSIWSRKTKNAEFVAFKQIHVNDGKLDAKGFVSVLQKGKPTEILDAAHLTASNPTISDSGVIKTQQEYEIDFFEGFLADINAVSDKDLVKLFKNLNSKEMRQLRTGMDLAAREGFSEPAAKLSDVKTELALTKNHLDLVNQMIIVEMKVRNAGIKGKLPKASNIKTSGKLFKELPILEKWKGHKKTENTLLRFSKHMMAGITSERGEAKYGLRQEIIDNFTKLCMESETVLDSNDKEKEGGVTYLRRNDESSEELNVSQIYISDFSRGRRSFDDGNEVKTSIETGFKSNDRKEISDHLTNFCNASKRKNSRHTPERVAEMNANQARRVQALLTQQTLAPIFFMQNRGEFGTHTKAKENNVSGDLVGESNYSFDVKRLFNGAVEVNIMQRLKPSSFNHKDDSGFITGQQFEFDGNKSYIQANLKLVVPRRKSAAPILREFTYATHLVNKNSEN